MVHALIFAGGTGLRMNAKSKPKQFLELHGKPVIIYTIEIFERHSEVDDIIVACLENWIPELQFQLQKNLIKKVRTIVPGGKTGHDSITNGLMAMQAFAKANDIVLIHDGVRPLIRDEIVTQNINAVRTYGSAITSSPALETEIRVEELTRIIKEVPTRANMYTAKAPQSFYYGDILKAHKKAEKTGFKAIDSVDLLTHFGRRDLHIVTCSRYNLKITEPADYYMFRALYEAMENEQIGDI